MLVKVGVHVYLCVRGEDRLYGLLLIIKKTKFVSHFAAKVTSYRYRWNSFMTSETRKHTNGTVNALLSSS